jgi:hypothetical protein
MRGVIPEANCNMYFVRIYIPSFFTAPFFLPQGINITPIPVYLKKWQTSSCNINARAICFSDQISASSALRFT